MAKQATLFDLGESEVTPKRRGKDAAKATIRVAAHQLTILFTEEESLPARFRKSDRTSEPSNGKQRKVKETTQLERTYRANAEFWVKLIETMLAKLKKAQAWRFIRLQPKIEPSLERVSDCKDFRDFVDYLILRRDKEECGDEELGGLAMLSTAFQREVERMCDLRCVAQRTEKRTGQKRGQKRGPEKGS